MDKTVQVQTDLEKIKEEIDILRLLANEARSFQEFYSTDPNSVDTWNSRKLLFSICNRYKDIIGSQRDSING